MLWIKARLLANIRAPSYRKWNLFASSLRDGYWMEVVQSLFLHPGWFPAPCQEHEKRLK